VTLCCAADCSILASAQHTQSRRTNANMTQVIVLVSSDKQRFPVPRAIAEQSLLLRNMVSAGNSGGGGGGGGDGSDNSTDDRPPVEGRGGEELPLPNIHSSVLKMVLEYLSFHINNPPVEIQKPLTEDIYHLNLPSFDVEFIEKGRTQREIYDIITAAMYLDIPSLVDLGCAKIASLIKGKNPR
jgi:hypothetical protein